MRDHTRYLLLRTISYLPDRLKIRMSRMPPVMVDGQQLDPQLQLIRSMRHPNRPGLVEPDVEAGRKRYRRETLAYRGPVTKVGAVRDLEIEGAGGPLAARLYEPREKTTDLTLYFHGGGFVLGDLETHDEPCRILCRHARVRVLSVAYRLAPEHPFPAALDDAAAALRWAQKNSGRVSIGGDSAGANLSAVICQESRANPPLAQLLIYPPTDGRTSWPSRDLFSEGFFLSRKDRSAFGRHYGAPETERVRDSPLRAPDLSKLPPALVITAGFDILRDEGEAYADALRAAGNIVHSQRYPGLGHGFVHLTGVCRTARRAMIDIAQQWREILFRA
ncbi:MAG: alpha/beta hydrolase [Acidobacteriota bacterium]|nr:alpha/beta hydrolase [Acidobacteriota bacterium]